MQRVLEANFLELKWTEMVKKTKKKNKKQKSMVRQSARLYIQKRINDDSMAISCCRHKKTRGLERRKSEREKKRGDLLTAHQVC